MSIRARILSSRWSPMISTLQGKSMNQQPKTFPLMTQTRNIFAAMKYLRDSRSKTKTEGDKLASVEKSKLRPEGIHGEKWLYQGNSAFTVRAMFAAGSVNFFGIDFGGQPIWTLFGYVGTGLVFYCNREYANHAAYLVYETTDGERLGFQMYNLLGFPGKKIEVDIGNARLANTVNWNLGSDSFVPLRVQGIRNNVLIDKDGHFFADGRLKQLLEAGGNGQANTKKIRVVKSDETKAGTWAHKLALDRSKKAHRKES